MEGIAIQNSWLDLRETGKTEGEARIRKAAEDFEALFYAELIREMRATLGATGLFGEGPGRAIYEGMFDTMLASEMARGGRLGVADQLLAVMARGDRAKESATSLVAPDPEVK